MKRNILILALLALWLILGMWFSYTKLCGSGIITERVEVPVDRIVERIVEKRVEVPVEKIVERIVEVPAKVAIAAIPKTPANPFLNWRISDGKFNTNANQFYRNTRNVASFLPKSKELNKSLKETASYLNTNKKRSINITGYYNVAEKNASIFPDLGLARANNSKNDLVNLGVSATQINVNSEKLGNRRANWFDKNTLQRSIDFTFTAYKGNNRVNDIKQRLFGKPITVQFASNADNLNLSAQQRKDISDLIYYLDVVKTGSLAVEGHTDGTGNKDYNVTLSKKRAGFVKDYLKKNGGILDNRMSIKGFGPDKPVASNSTSIGRAKNRRVEVILR